MEPGQKRAASFMAQVRKLASRRPFRYQLGTKLILW